MKNTSLFVETLESRVAPAILVNGGNLLGGAGNPTTGETSSGGNTVTLIKVLSGQALVFYDASNSEILGISVGKNTRLDITGNVVGDIVTNLLPSGRLSDSDHNPANGEDGGILLPYTIKGITTHPLGPDKGDIGRIIAGGSDNNINIAGSLNGLYAGNGIFRDGATAIVNVGSVDVNTILPGLQNTFVLTQANAVAGSKSDIHNVAVHTANQLEIFAGSGANGTTTAGNPGGTITNVSITETLTGQGSKPALFLHAGDGGSGTAGGEGGGITNFDDMGSIAYVKIQTGDGGAGSTGDGGAGGSLESSTIITSSPRYDLLMGHGGSGLAGGKGGTISTLNFTNNVNGGKSLIATADFNGDGIQDVLLINTVTGEGTLSLGTGGTDTPYVIALQTVTNPDGTTSTTPFIAAEGAVPTSVVAVDLNGDGRTDFVVSYASTNDLGEFINNGNGTFTASAVALPASPTRIAAGHFTGTTATDFAVLSGGDLAALDGGQNSQVFIAQNDGTGHLTVLSNPATLPGIGTNIVAAQVDGAGGTDIFVGLKSGGIDPLFATGTSFTLGTTIAAFGTPVDNLDVATSPTGAVTLLAFSGNVNAGDPTSTVVAPQINLISIKSDGTANGTVVIMPDPGATTAHFVGGIGTIGVVNNSAVSLYENTGTYTVVSSLTSTGVLTDFSGTMINGTTNIVAVGAATNRFFYSSGSLDSSEGLPAFKNFNIPFEERIISFTAGDGGDGGTHVGGRGGSVKGLTYTQTLGGGVIEAGGGYNTFVTTGNGGSSTGGAGGKGGDLASVAISLNPGYDNLGQDDTDFAFLRTGNGGSGTSGGSGGDITKTTSTSVFKDIENSEVIFGAVALQMETGNGGVGSVKDGGAGGSITLGGPAALSGVTFYDVSSQTPEAPALLVESGNGGAGVMAGGAGGQITNVGAQNAAAGNLNIARNELGSAQIVSGKGGDSSQGDGGAGGGITGLNVSVQNYEYTDQTTGLPVFFYGSLTVAGGAGGNSAGGHGGDGGGVAKSTLASATGDPNLGFGVLTLGGVGGDGTLGGGAGGGIKKLVVNTPSDPSVYAAVLAGGTGGNATGSGAGGAGGTIKSISQSKDVNSAINAILGGSGGNSVNGVGGVGGSIKNVATVGFLGLPAGETGFLGVFDDEIPSTVVQSLFAGQEVSQGLFAGRGGNGAVNGSVHNVVARQIAAIGAVVDENGLFGVAASVTNITADLIGYELDGGITVSPAAAKPIDGFILAAAVSGVTTIDNGRTAALTFNG